MSDGDSLNMDSSSFAGRMRQPSGHPSNNGFIDQPAVPVRRVQPRPEQMPPVQPRQINDFGGSTHASNPVPAQPRQIQHPGIPTPRQQMHLQSNPMTQRHQPIQRPAQPASISRSIAPVTHPSQTVQPHQQAQVPHQQPVHGQHPNTTQQHPSQRVDSGQAFSPQPVHQTQHTAFASQTNHHQTHHQQEHPIGRSTKKQKPGLALKAGMVGLAVAVFAIGMGVSLNTLRQNKEAQQQLAQLTKEANQTTTSNTSPTKSAVLGTTTTQANNSNFTVLPDQPKTLIIPKIQLNTLSQPVVLDQKGLITAPSDIKNVSWYSSSAKPGEIPTAMVISGLVGTATQPGAFNQIDKLTIGDSVQVIRGDGQTYNFKIVKTAAFDQNTQNPGTLLSPSKPGVPSLVLVTSTPPTTGTTPAQGTAVYAEQI